MLHIPPTNLLLLPAKQEPYKKAYLLSKILKNFLGKKSGVGQQAEKGKTERVTELGRRLRKDIYGKVESNDSPEIQDRRGTSDIPGLPSGNQEGRNIQKGKIPGSK